VTRSLDEIMSTLAPDERAAVHKRAQELIAEHRRLRGANDPTDRILKGLQSALQYAEGREPAKVFIPGIAYEMMTQRDQVLFESIRTRDSWRFKDWKTTQKAMQLGQQMHPHLIWSFYHLDPIEDDPERKLWLVTAHQQIPDSEP
jgi:hypothetical protein